MRASPPHRNRSPPQRSPPFEPPNEPGLPYDDWAPHSPPCLRRADSCGARAGRGRARDATRHRASGALAMALATALATGGVREGAAYSSHGAVAVLARASGARPNRAAAAAAARTRKSRATRTLRWRRCCMRRCAPASLSARSTRLRGCCRAGTRRTAAALTLPFSRLRRRSRRVTCSLRGAASDEWRRRLVAAGAEAETARGPARRAARRAAHWPR